MGLEDTDFYKSLPEYRQRIVMDAYERWCEASGKDETESVIEIYTKNFKQQDERRKREHERWKDIQIITYHVLDHPNDDPQGYAKASKPKIKR